MTLQSALIVILISLLILWLVSFLYNVLYFLSQKSNHIDQACFNKSRSFDEAYDDLKQLELINKTNYHSAKEKVRFYERNAQQTNRKYLYYADRIEEGFIRLYLGRFLSKLDVFKQLDLPVKVHFIFLLICCALVLLLFVLIFIVHIVTNFGLFTFLVGSTLIAMYVHFFTNIISINCAIFYALINLFLYIGGVDRSKLFRNTGILNFLTAHWSGFDPRNMIIGAASVGSFHSYSRDGFGGYGGGSFGGGGAGGSW